MTDKLIAVGGIRYKEVKNAMLAALAAQEWKGGEVIPSEKRLADRFNVSIGTLRKAIDELCAENILIRHQGLGTFVTQHQRNRHFFRYFRIVRQDGEKSYPTVTLVSFRKGKATREFAQLLGIGVGARTITFTNRLALHGETVMTETITVADARFPDLTEAALRERPNTLYSFYQAVYQINVVTIEERLRACLALESDSELLDVPLGMPLLELRRVAYSYHHEPVEVRISHVNTNRYEYVGASTLHEESSV